MQLVGRRTTLFRPRELSNDATGVHTSCSANTLADTIDCVFLQDHNSRHARGSCFLPASYLGGSEGILRQDVARLTTSCKEKTVISLERSHSPDFPVECPAAGRNTGQDSIRARPLQNTDILVSGSVQSARGYHCS